MSGTLETSDSQTLGKTNCLGVHYQLLWTLLEIFRQYGQCDYAIIPEVPADQGEYEGSFWYTGCKARAIEALYRLTPERAYEAAVYNLRQRDHHDRTLYPSQIMAFAASDRKEEAARLLFDIAREETSYEVLWAMGLAIAEAKCDSVILEALQDKSYETRLTACRLSSRLQTAPELVDCLRWMIEHDEESEVALAADAALKSLIETDETDRLVQALQTEASLEVPNRLRMWNLLDAMLRLGCPGLEFTPLPPWIETVRQTLASHFFMQKYFDDGISKSQRKWKEKAKKLER